MAQERARKYAELTVAEKITLNTTRAFLSSKPARTFAFFYIATLHVLVFSTVRTRFSRAPTGCAARSRAALRFLSQRQASLWPRALKGSLRFGLRSTAVLPVVPTGPSRSHRVSARAASSLWGGPRGRGGRGGPPGGGPGALALSPPEVTPCPALLSAGGGGL